METEINSCLEPVWRESRLNLSTTCTRITRAVEEKSPELLKLLLPDEPDNPNVQRLQLSMLESMEEEDNSPLCAAAYEVGNLDCVEFLLDKGCDVNGRNPDLFTALQIAVLNADWDMVSLLKKRGASLFYSADKKKVPFLLALDSGHKDNAIKELLPSDINEQNFWLKTVGHEEAGFGFTMLTHSCYAGHLKAVEILVEESGANIETRDVQETFDQYAHYNKHFQKDESQPYLSIIQYLLKHVGVGFKFANGTTPLQLMAHYNIGKSLSLLKTLLELGFDPNQRLDNDGCTHLMKAARENDTEAVELLVEYGADPDILDNGNSHALYYTSSLDCTLAILKANPDMNIYRGRKENEPVQNPFLETLAIGDIAMVSHLVSAGISLNDISEDICGWGASAKYEWGFEIYEEIANRSMGPRSLIESAKLAVKRYLGHICVDEKITQLPIPKELQAYLQSTYMDPLFILERKQHILDCLDIPGISSL